LASTVTILGDKETATTTAAATQSTAAESAATSDAAVRAKRDKCIKDLQFLKDGNMDPLD